MSAGEPARRRLHLVPRPDAVEPSPAVCRNIPLQCDWQLLMSDIGAFGVVDVRVRNAVASLVCTAAPRHVDVGQHGALLSGEGIRIIAALRNLSGATIENGEGRSAADHALRCVDWAEREALRVTLTDTSAWSSFHALLVRQWAKRGAPRTVIGTPDGNVIEALAELQQYRPQLHLSQIADSWYIRRGGADGMPLHRVGQRVDPTLMAPFLETVTDQAFRLRVSVGNLGVVQRVSDEFYDCKYQRGGIVLRGGNASFRLATDGVAAASVIRVGPRDRQRRVIRLFDEQWRTVASLAAAPDEDGGDPWLWRTLIRALGN